MEPEIDDWFDVGDVDEKKGVCSKCGERTVVVWEDCGVGRYESNGFHDHVDFQQVTECCNSYYWEEVYDG